MFDTLIIGAGLSGLTAAVTLAESGSAVRVLDKGRGVGGRLATRRIGDATLDHGAQFFTVRGDEFRTTIDAAIADGVVDIWCHGFGEEDGYPRYFCPAGMTALAKWLAQRLDEAGGQLIKSERASAVTTSNGRFSIPVEADTHHLGEHVIVTCPVPQTLDLLDAGGIALDHDLNTTLRDITYKPTLALLISLGAPSAVPAPGGVQRTEEDLFTFITDNAQKGVSASPALTFHLNGALSEARWNDNPAIVIADLLREATPWLGGAPIVEVELKKWRYAGPHTPHPDRCVVALTQPGKLILAGDAFGGPKVEGAFNSGLAAAAAITAE